MIKFRGGGIKKGFTVINFYFKRLSYLPNISKWKFNNKIKINNIFKQCNSLLIIPDISKWNINLTENINTSSIESIFIKTVNSDSLLSGNIVKYSNISEKSSSLKENNNIELFENNNYIGSKNEELENYYDNFYN